jgi:transposase InsO family protein
MPWDGTTRGGCCHRPESPCGAGNGGLSSPTGAMVMRSRRISWRSRLMWRRLIRWGGEITDVWTAAGWESLAVWLDLPSRQVVGWALQSRIEAALGQAAWRMARGCRRPSAGRIQHADRGSH